MTGKQKMPKMGGLIAGGVFLAAVYHSAWADTAPLKAGSHPFALKTPAKGSTIWWLDPESTQVQFQITSNSAGTITGQFVNGARGWLNLTDEKHPQGYLAVQLDTLKSVNAKGEGNPMRDMNVVEAFFGVRDSAAQKEPVKAVWAKLSAYLQPHVKEAGFELTQLTDLKKFPDGQTGTAHTHGYLFLWNTLRLKASWPIAIHQQKELLTVKSTAPFVFNLETVLGKTARNLLFDTMLAAGCAHQAGIQNEVKVSLSEVVFNRQPQ